jgi:hypothetical protein
MARTRRIDANATAVLGAALALLALGISANARAGAGALTDAPCMTDADCGGGFECDLGPTATRDCGSDDGECDATPPEARSGRCEPKKMTCEVDADCVSGLACEHHDSGDDCAVAAPKSSADGGTPPDEPEACEPAEPEPGECAYRFVGCTKDSDCDGDLVCTPLGSTSECSSDAPVPCEQGQDCPAPEPEKCTETTRSYCFPARVDCERDADCDADTRCVALSADAQENPPPAWEGATALCLPEAIALVLEGRVDASGDVHASSDESSSAKDNDLSAGGGAPQANGKSAGPAGAGKSAQPADDGCAVSAPGSRDAGQSWLLLFGAAALFVRRRTR